MGKTGKYISQQYIFLFGFVCLVSVTSYNLYPTRVFGDAESAAQSIGFISAAIYGISSLGLKLTSTHETWLYGTRFAKSHARWRAVIRYTSITAATALVGVLMYYISFDLTTMEYSESLWYDFRMIAGVAAGTIVALPWIASKL